MYINIHIYIYSYIYINKYIFIYTYIPRVCENMSQWEQREHHKEEAEEDLYAYMCICVYVCVFVFVCMYI
jgi:hypothetical protein